MTIFPSRQERLEVHKRLVIPLKIAHDAQRLAQQGNRLSNLGAACVVGGFLCVVLAYICLALGSPLSPWLHTAVHIVVFLCLSTYLAMEIYAQVVFFNPSEAISSDERIRDLLLYEAEIDRINLFGNAWDEHAWQQRVAALHEQEQTLLASLRVTPLAFLTPEP